MTNVAVRLIGCWLLPSEGREREAWSLRKSGMAVGGGLEGRNKMKVFRAQPSQREGMRTYGLGDLGRQTTLKDLCFVVQTATETHSNCYWNLGALWTEGGPVQQH